MESFVTADVDRKASRDVAEGESEKKGETKKHHAPFVISNSDQRQNVIEKVDDEGAG